MMTKEEIQQFKALFSAYCRSEINKGRCDDNDCPLCCVDHAYDEIFGNLSRTESENDD